MRARTRLIRLQRQLTTRLQVYARELLGGLNPELKKYFLRYQKDFGDFKEVTTKRELLIRVQRTAIVLCGDYHTLSQAQRTVIRLLRETVPRLKRRKRSLVLALEMLRPSDDAKVAKFLAGEYGEGEFLEAIDFRRNWGFHWANYRRLFQFAKEHGIRVVGINLSARGAPSLKARDRYAAKTIAALSLEDPGALVFVLVGDMHLAQKHLPREIEAELKRRGTERSLLIIHQNVERFYWKLVELGLEQLVDVVKVTDRIFCVMNTPPWIKLRSHVKWAELTAEGESPRLPAPRQGNDDDDDDAADAFSAVGFTEEIRELAIVIQSFLGLEQSVVEDDFSVYGPGDLSFLNRLSASRRWTSLERRVIARCLTEFESFFIPRENVVFLSDLSLNHAATQTATYLHAKLSGYDRVFTEPGTDFYPAIWIEALGFFGSRILNHKRKCNGPGDLQRLVESLTPAQRRKPTAKVAAAALDHLTAEWLMVGTAAKRLNARLPRETRDVPGLLHYLKTAKLLGQLLGYAMHTAVMEGRVTREAVRELFHDPFAPDHARKLYLEWIRRLDAYGFRDVVKTEML